MTEEKKKVSCISKIYFVKFWRLLEKVKAFLNVGLRKNILSSQGFEWAGHISGRKDSW